MSIATQLQRIKQAKEALKQAINAKGGTLTDEKLDAYAEAVSELSSGGGSFYMCASVEGATWSGYKALLDGDTGIWSFSEEVTSGLPYDKIIPQVGKVYSFDAMIEVKLWDGRIIYDEFTAAIWTFEGGLTSSGNVTIDLPVYNASISDDAKYGSKALGLLSSQGYTRITMPEFDRTKDYTVDFWCKVNPFPGSIMLYLNNPVENAFSPATNDYLLGVYCTQEYVCLHGGNYGGETTLWDMPVSTLIDGSYHHVAIVRTGDTVMFAMDGHFSNDQLHSASPYLNDIPIHFGWINGEVYSEWSHNGMVLDNIRFSNTARWTQDFMVPSESFE